MDGPGGSFVTQHIPEFISHYYLPAGPKKLGIVREPSTNVTDYILGRMRLASPSLWLPTSDIGPAFIKNNESMYVAVGDNFYSPTL